MNLKSLKIFCDIVTRKSFSRAAEDNGLSQSGASQVVSQLESRLGVQLIERSKRPLMPTHEGRVFFEGCRDIVARYDALEDELRDLKRGRGCFVEARRGKRSRAPTALASGEVQPPR